MEEWCNDGYVDVQCQTRSEYHERTFRESNIAIVWSSRKMEEDWWISTSRKFVVGGNLVKEVITEGDTIQKRAKNVQK